jgi:hypothetical protein
MRGRASAALAVGCLIVVFSAAAATAATRSQVFRVEIAGYDAKYPDQLFQIRYRGPFSKGGGVHTLECPVRCAFAFGPGTGVSAPVSFTVADDSSSSRAISAYETKFGLPYQVLGYQGCKAAFLSDPLQSSCSGQTSRSTTIRISLRYRPLLRVALTGQVEAHPGPPVGGGFLRPRRDIGHRSLRQPRAERRRGLHDLRRVRAGGVRRAPEPRCDRCLGDRQPGSVLAVRRVRRAVCRAGRPVHPDVGRTHMPGSNSPAT